jgi:hypothetical protein
VLQRHGAELDVTSTPGKGSTFTCHFPPRRLSSPWVRCGQRLNGPASHSSVRRRIAAEHSLFSAVTGCQPGPGRSMETADLSHHISRRFNEDLERVRGKVLPWAGSSSSSSPRP